MSTAKTHILRVKPPWRQDGNRTRCGRRAEGRMTAIQPDAQMPATARPYWQWSVIIRGGNAHLAPPQVRETYPGVPAGLCVPCWLNLGRYGYQDWRADPLEVLRVDLAVKDDHGRRFLARVLPAIQYEHRTSLAMDMGHLNRPDRNLAMAFTVTRRCSS